MMQPKSFLFGMIVIPSYGYNCVMTNAQLELIAVDKAVSYIKRDKKNKTRDKMSPPSSDKIAEAINNFNKSQNSK